MRPILLLFLLLGMGVRAFAQPFPTDPDSAQIVTTDIDNFWRAFDLAAPKSKTKFSNANTWTKAHNADTLEQHRLVPRQR